MACSFFSFMKCTQILKGQSHFFSHFVESIGVSYCLPPGTKRFWFAFSSLQERRIFEGLPWNIQFFIFELFLLFFISELIFLFHLWELFFWFILVSSMLRTGPRWIKDYTTHTKRWGCIQAWKETIETLYYFYDATATKKKIDFIKEEIQQKAFYTFRTSV